MSGTGSPRGPFAESTLSLCEGLRAPRDDSSLEPTACPPVRPSYSPSIAFHHTRRISLAPRAFGSIMFRFQYHRSGSGALMP
jgi:hypothetical protein